MDFGYEVLGDEKFQKFCQALIVGSFPNVQCLPVGQPDGGRDAFSRHDTQFIVFQVKYSKDPSSKTEREAIEALISSEASKVAALVKRGAASYYLLTNVSGTSHLDHGSIDKVNEALTREFGIPSYVWWRDDLDRRIEISKNLLWRYPELARGQDFLEFLAKERAEQAYTNATRRFVAYMATQYLKEAEVKFQQVQIQNDLFDLFTDTPIGQARENFPSKTSLAMTKDEYENFESSINRQRNIFDDDDRGELAANWLLKASPKSGLQRIVLEGAPGQGKSTVTQYLCQLHRMIALNKGADNQKIPQQHRQYILRLPIRVDLRDYALWLSGKDPLASEKGISRPSGSEDSLESLIAYQIHRISGQDTFSLQDLLLVIHGSHCLLVLDGFDEVADTITRAKLIEQIRFASARMEQECLSLQVIVTSRPNAFIMSPGFSEREWAHMALLPMHRQQVIQYADKWISARGMTPNDCVSFKELLLDRINRSHIRSLAQNPMQLAILLNLISTKGMSLPDKRTALYDSYMDLFFGREAEKDETVRENRDILLQIHQYVAWMLQLDAEVPGGTGSISQGDLQKVVTDFLAEKEHKGDVLKLFIGAVERVGALVSRVQGLLEFEVQPLREYFAGKFLYETAPYSPPGAERRGTKPDRFAALAGRPYWSNVIRFYAGCYSSGELLSLVAGLEELIDGKNYVLRIHALQLALLFLNDYVFAQEPKTVRKVVELITTKENLRYLTAGRRVWEETLLSLPEKCGRAQLLEISCNYIKQYPEAAFLARLGAIVRMNSSIEFRYEFWKALSCNLNKKIGIAKSLGLFFESDPEQSRKIIEILGEDALEGYVFVGRWDNLSFDQKILALDHSVKTTADEAALRGWWMEASTDLDLFWVYILLNPYTFAFMSYRQRSDVPLEAIFHSRNRRVYGETTEFNAFSDEAQKFNDVAKACSRLSKIPISAFSSELSPWSDLIESARRTWGDEIRVMTLAGLAAGIKSKQIKSSNFDKLLDHKLPMAERARFARLKSSVDWWRVQLEAVSSISENFFVLLLLISWAPGGVIRELANLISEKIDNFPASDLVLLYSSIDTIISITSDRRQPIVGIEKIEIDGIKSVRLQAILMLRLPKALSKQISIDLASKRISDPCVCRLVADQLVSILLRDPKIWPEARNFFAKNVEAYDFFSNGFQGFPDMFFRYGDKLVKSCAEQIIGVPTEIPMILLQMAEESLSRNSNEGISTLSVLISEDEWFS